MVALIFSLLLTALSICFVSYILPGIKVRSLGTAFVVALVYAVLHALLFKLLVVLTLPITILTLGLFLFVINAFLLWVTTRLVPGFEVRGAGMTVLAAAAISVVSSVLHWVFF
jgi:putative membrane protein